ncbi:MAG: hypothetical protein WCO99_08860 [Planctomycetota bacterium]
MASLIKYINGSFRIEVVVPDGSLKRIRLGKLRLKTSESWHRRVEALVSDLAAGEPHGRGLAAWPADLPIELHERRVKAGLADRRAATTTVTVGPFLAARLEARKPEYKVASVRAWQQVVDGLTESWIRLSDRRSDSRKGRGVSAANDLRRASPHHDPQAAPARGTDA